MKFEVGNLVEIVNARQDDDYDGCPACKNIKVGDRYEVKSVRPGHIYPYCLSIAGIPTYFPADDLKLVEGDNNGN